MAGAGFFGTNFGVGPVIVSLIGHIIYGWILGRFMGPAAIRPDLRKAA
jgi:hypothetical protein